MYIFILNNMAMINLYMGEHSKSIELQQSCVKLALGLVGKFHPDYRKLLGSLAKIYHTLGIYDKSLRLYIYVAKLI